MKTLKKVTLITDERPPLQAGSYELGIQQEVTISDDDFNVGDKGHKKVKFGVLGNRFQLNPSVIHSCYPPPGGNGFYDEVLPHIVFNKATLPWEYSVETAAIDKSKGWLCVVLFNENEIANTADDSKEKITEETAQVKNLKYILGDPRFGETGEDICQVINIPTALANKTIPKYDDLDWLTHVRSVSTADKTEEINNLSKDKEGKKEHKFSVVVGNRLPTAGETHFAYLLSIHGRQDDLAGNSKEQFKTFVYLKKWKFYAQESLGRVHDYLDSIKADSFRLDPSAAKHKALKKYFANGFFPANHLTYKNDKMVSWYRGPLVPLKVKDQSFNPGDSYYSSADKATLYDEDTGMFNLSYSAAWKLGQLLTLRNHQVATELYLMKGRLSTKALKNHNIGNLQPTVNSTKKDFQEQIAAEFELILAQFSLQIKNQVKQQFEWKPLKSINTRPSQKNLNHFSFRNYVIAHYETQLKEKIDEVAETIEFTDPAIFTMLDELHEITKRECALLRKRHNPDLADIYLNRCKELLKPDLELSDNQTNTAGKSISWSEKQKNIIKHFENRDNDSLTDNNPVTVSTPQVIKDWFGNLSLLKGVPLAYLIPNEQLIPAESLRFFHLDPDWINALLDGVNSIGRITEWDKAIDQLQSPVLRSDGHQTAINIRNSVSLEGFKSLEKGSTNIRSGLLLRSQIVQDWPGLEIEGYDRHFNSKQDVQKNTKPKHPLLRMEKLAPDLLLCIFEGSVESVFIQEPSEGIHFGFAGKSEGQHTLKLRDPRDQPDPSMESPIVEFSNNELFRDQDADKKVIDVSGLKDKVKSAVVEHFYKTENDYKFNAAEFGIQMIRSMQREVFNIKDNDQDDL